MRPSVKKALRRTFKWTVILALVLIIAVVAIFVWLTQSNAGRQLVARQVESAVNGQVLDATVSIGNLRSVWPRLQIEDVELLDSDGFPAAAVRSVSVDYRLRPLFGGELRIEAAVVDGANVRARIREDGGLNLASLTRPRPEGPPRDGEPLSVFVHEITLTDCGVSLRDARNEDARLLVVSELEVEAELALDGGLDVELGRLDARLGHPLDLDAMVPVGLDAVSVALAGGRINFRSTRLRFGDTTLDDLHGELATAGASPFERIDLEIPAIELHPKDVAPFLGGMELLEPLRIQARVEGPADAVLVDVPIEGPAGRIELSLTLDLSEPTSLGYAGLARVSRFRPADWLSIDLDADVSAAVYLEGRGITPDEAVVGARIEVGPTSIEGVPIEEAIVSARYADGELTISQLGVASLDTSIAGEASLAADGAFTLSLEAEAADISAYAEYLPEHLGTPTGTFDLDVVLSGTAPIDDLQNGVEATPDQIREWTAEVTGSGTVVANELSFAGLEVGSLNASFEAEAVAGAPAGTINLDGSSISLPGVSIDRVRLVAELEGDRLDSSGTVTAHQMGLEASYQVSAELQDERLIVDARSLTARISDIDVAFDERVRVVATLDDEMRPLEIRVDPATIGVMNVPVRLEAWHRLGDGALALTASAPDIALQPLAARFAPKIGLDGNAYIGRVIAGGTLSRPTLSTAGGVRGLEVLGLPTYDVEFELEFDGAAARGSARVGSRGAEIAVVSLDGAGLPLDVDLTRGRVGIDFDGPLDATLDVTRLKLGEFASVLPDGVVAAARGHVALSARATGTPDQPRIEFETSLDNATLSVPLGAERWEVPNVSVALSGDHTPMGASSSVSVTVEARLGERQLVSADVDASVPDRAALIEDATDALGDLSLVASSRVFAIEVTDLPPAIRDGIGLESGRADIDASWRGTIRSGVGRVEVAANDVAVGPVPSFSARVVASTDASTAVDGVVWFGEGATPTSLAGTGAPLPSEQAEAESSGRPHVVVNGRASAALGTLLDPEALDSTAVEARVTVPSTDAGRLATLVELPDVARGTVAGYIDLFGTLSSPRAFARFALREVDLIGGGVGTVGVQANYESGLAGLSLVACDGSADGLELHASTSVDLSSDSLRAGLAPTTSWPLRASVRANSRLDSLAPTLLLGAIVDGVQGVVDVSVEVSGTIGRPEIVGTASIIEGELGIIPLARRLEEVEVELNFSETGIELSSLRARDDDGVVRGSGIVMMEAFEPQSFDLSLRARDFPALDGSGVTAFASGDVSVRGTIDSRSIDAVASLDGLEIDLNFGAAGAGPTRRAPWVYLVGEQVALDQVGSRQPQQLVEQSVAMSDGPSLELALDIRTESLGVVRHQFGHVDFTIDMAVDVGEELVLDGVVGLPSGVNRVLGNQFEYRRGEIRFSPDDSEVNPAIDVLLVHELSADVSEYLSERVGPPQEDRATIRLPVVGRLSELAADDWSVPLRSDPMMSESDTLSVLVQGRLGGDTDQESQQGVQALAQLGLGALGDRFSGGAIDTISIEASGQTARVEGGKYVHDDVYVSGTYIRSPDDDDDNNFEVTLEWILRRIGAGSLRLELRGGDRAKGGLEFLYNLRRMAPEREGDAGGGSNADL